MRATGLAGAIGWMLVLAGCPGTTAPDLGFLVQVSGTPPTTAEAGATLPIAVKVLHKESGGATTPASGKTVTLTVTAGGGTINGSASATVTSGTDGSVSASWHLGTALGAQTLRGSVSATEFLDVTITATQPPATTLVLTTAASASAQSGAALAVQPTVQLKDANNNNVPQAGVAVTATILSGGGALAGATTVNTNASGAAVFTDLAISGIIGTRTLNFSATLNGTTVNLASAPIALAAGAAAQLAVKTQPSGNAVAGVALSQQPAVQLLDAAGNNAPQTGVVVTASVATGAATVAAGATATTDAGGVATFAGLTLSTAVVGPVTLGFGATLGGQARTVASGAIALIPPPKLIIATAPTAAPQSGIPIFQQPVIQLADGAGTPVLLAGVAVTASVPVGNGILSGTATMNTDASGQAKFTDLVFSGSGPYTLQFTAPGYTQAVSGTLTVNGAPVVNTLVNGLGELGAFSGSGGTEVYAKFIVPAGTNELRFDTYGGPGDVTLFVRHGAYPTLKTNEPCPLNASSGPVQRCVLKGGSIISGTWYLVVHGVTDYSNLRLQAIAYGPPCNQIPLTLGVSTGARTLTNGVSCMVPFSTPTDRFLLNTSQGDAVTFTLNSTDFVSMLFKEDVSPSGRYDFGVATGGTTWMFLMPGRPLEITTFQFASGGQQYSLVANQAASPNPAGCVERATFNGLNMLLSLQAAACPGTVANTYSNRIYFAIGGGQTATITMSTPTFAPRLRLLSGLVKQGVAVPLLSVDGSTSQAAMLVYTNPGTVTANYTIEATSVLALQTGGYTLTVNLSPSYFNLAPPILAGRP